MGYAAWHELRIVSGANDVWPGATALKALAKTYNAYLMERLGVTRCEGKTGYRLCTLKVHDWIVEQQVLAGVPAHKIPKVIRYKISLDGSMMGSRDVELVAIVPLNLGVAPQSLHAVYPIAMYEGKEKREELEKDLGWVAPEMRMLEKPRFSTTTGKTHRCEWVLCADLFALTKVMRAADGNGSCPCCEGVRNSEQGWDACDTLVWDEIPDDPLPLNLFGVNLKSCVYCLLHMKVRIAGTLLQHMAREAETNKQVDT